MAQNINGIEPSDTNYKLNRIDKHLNAVHRRQLRLGAILAGIPEGHIDSKCASGELPSLQNIHQRLKEHGQYSSHPTEALCALLKFAKLNLEKIELLAAQSDLTTYYEQLLSYSQLMVELCQELTDEDFRTLRNFATDYLDCDAENIASLEDMFLKLHQNLNISRDKTELLIDWMGEINRKDLSDKITSAELLPRVMQETQTANPTTMSSPGLQMQQTPVTESAPAAQPPVAGGTSGKSAIAYTTRNFMPPVDSAVLRDAAVKPKPALKGFHDQDTGGRESLRDSVHTSPPKLMLRARNETIDTPTTDRPDSTSLGTQPQDANDSAPPPSHPSQPSQPSHPSHTSHPSHPSHPSYPSSQNASIKTRPSASLQAQPRSYHSDRPLQTVSLESHGAHPEIPEDFNNPAGNMGYKRPFPSLLRRCCISWLCIAIIAFIGVLLIVSGSTGTRLLKTKTQGVLPEVPQLAVSNYTIVLSEVDSYWHSKVDVIETVKSGDFPHDSSIYLVQKVNLKRRENISIYTSMRYHNEDQFYKTGSVEYINAIDGSRLSYKICVTSELSSQPQGMLYLFDNNTKYEAYIRSGLEPVGSIANRSVPIGHNDFPCTTFTYDVTRSSFYFITVSTPANIDFQYNYTFRLIQYNRLDYEEDCVVNKQKPCTLDLASNSGTWTVLAYVHPLRDSDPYKTHLMVTAGGNAAFDFPALSNFCIFVIVAGVVHVVACLFICCVLYQCCRPNKKGFCSQCNKDGYNRLN